MKHKFTDAQISFLWNMRDGSPVRRRVRGSTNQKVVFDVLAPNGWQRIFHTKPAIVNKLELDRVLIFVGHSDQNSELLVVAPLFQRIVRSLFA